ncbi:unnamed protein product [Ixodes persulcatus]
MTIAMPPFLPQRPLGELHNYLYWFGFIAFDSARCDCSFLALIGHFVAETYMVEGVSGVPTPISQVEAQRFTTNVRTRPGRDALPEITGETWLHRNKINRAAKPCKLKILANITRLLFCTNLQ